MNVVSLSIPEVKVLTPVRHRDPRGFFSETWQQQRFADAGIPGPFIQDNHAVSTERGVVRGLHLQIGPNAQGKLVRVLKGAIWDVAIDIRTGSPTYGQHVGATLSAENGSQLWVPKGFLHGFCALEADTDVMYKVDAPYDRAAERGIIWNDPTLALPWPLEPGAAIVSDKDQELPGLDAAAGWFTV